jgi:hypothetical protein
VLRLANGACKQYSWEWQKNAAVVPMIPVECGTELIGRRLEFASMELVGVWSAKPRIVHFVIRLIYVATGFWGEDLGVPRCTRTALQKSWSRSLRSASSGQDGE